MTHGYTAWHAIARLLDDIALIVRTLRLDRDAQPCWDIVESAPMPCVRAGTDFRVSSAEQGINGKHTINTIGLAANDNCGAASVRTMLRIHAVCSLGCEIDLSFA